MEYKIRVAVPTDGAAIAALSQQLGYEATVEETVERVELVTQSQHDVLFVAVAAEQVVAWVHAFVAIRIESAPFVEIGGLVVQEEFRGRGIATQLLQQISTRSRQRSISKLRVRCHVSRTNTHLFYRNSGFSQSKEQKVFEMPI